MVNFKRKTKLVCANCHFLKLINKDKGETFHRELRDEHREKIKRGNFDEVVFSGDEKRPYRFKCYKEYWSEEYPPEGYSFSEEDRQKEINVKSRKDKCYFWEYRNGTNLPAAEERQKIDYESDRFRKNRRLTIIALWISGIALLIAIIALFKNGS